MPRKGSCKSPTSVVYYSLCIEKKASVSSFRTHYASNFPSFIEKFGLNKKKIHIMLLLPLTLPQPIALNQHLFNNWHQNKPIIKFKNENQLIPLQP